MPSHTESEEAKRRKLSSLEENVEAGNPLKLTAAQIDEAFNASPKKITSWEQSFYMDLLTRHVETRRTSVTTKQQVFIDQIHQKLITAEFSALWQLSKQQVEEASKTGKLSEWEVGFIKSSFDRESFSDKQLPIVDRIRDKLAAPTNSTSGAWRLTVQQADDALASGAINQWERDFISNNWQRETFSEKQQVIVDRIQKKIKGGGGGGVGSSSGAANHQGGAVGTGLSGDSTATSAPGFAHTIQQIKDGAVQGKISDWERQFYIDNLGKVAAGGPPRSEKQLDIQKAIEAKMAVAGGSGTKGGKRTSFG